MMISHLLLRSWVFIYVAAHCRYPSADSVNNYHSTLVGGQFDLRAHEDKSRVRSVIF